MTRKKVDKDIESKKEWKKIGKLMDQTKDLDVENVLIVSLEQWNPTILSEKRKEILLTLKKRKVKSEKELAHLLKRKRENVVKDLALLEYYGLVKRVREKNRVIPQLMKCEIVIYS